MTSLLFCAFIATQPVRMYVLDGGRGRLLDSRLLSDVGDAPSSPVDLADPCFLIQHGKQWLMWDTGLPDSLVGTPQDSAMLHLEKKATMTDQLAKIGLKPEEIDFVAFSHMHFDHTGTANLFGASTWILQRKELNHALEEPSPFSVVAGSFTAYKSAKKLMIDGDYDVFGDGTVEMLWTPGHTPGHMWLQVQLAKVGSILLSGDLFHQRASLQKGWVPTINSSRSQTKSSIERIEELTRNKKVRIVIQHDPQDYDQLPKAPSYLD